MPYPTPQPGDAVVYVSNDGTTPLPAIIVSVDAKDDATLFVIGPGSTSHIVYSAHDEKKHAGGSWAWPTNAGAASGASSTHVGTKYSAVPGDQFIFMTRDAIRTVTLPAGVPIGKVFTVVDTSGSITTAHTITFTARAGSILGRASIIPGSGQSCTLVHTGANVWAVTAHF